MALHVWRDLVVALDNDRVPAAEGKATQNGEVAGQEPEDEAFRAELREWLAANLPEFENELELGEGVAEAGWAAINWPREWGGRDATITQSVIYAEEMARARAPGLYNTSGIWQIGPMITRWGTEEQKRRWVRGILHADEHWCQGFSEPEAGSDLANLRCLAVPDGDDYPVSGQKIPASAEQAEPAGPGDRTAGGCATRAVACCQAAESTSHERRDKGRG